MISLYIRDLSYLLAVCLLLPGLQCQVLRNPSNRLFERASDDYLPVEERLVDVATEVERNVNVESSRSKLKADGTFSDLDVNDPDDLMKHGNRLGAIILDEVTKKGSLSPASEESLRFLAYDAPSINSTNWWTHCIGVPENMWVPIFMARNYIDDNVKSRFIERYFSKTQRGPVWDLTDHTGKMAGGNMAPRMLIGLVEYLLKDSLEEFYPQAKDVLHREVVLRQAWKGDGLRQDGCLHQHNLPVKRKQPDGSTVQSYLEDLYAISYGKEFLQNAARFMWILDGSKFDLGDEIEEGIFASFLECEQWLYRYHTVEPTAVGRFINSGQRVTYYGGKGAILLPLEYFQKMNKHQDEFEAALHRYNNVRPEKQFSLEGNKHFFVSDLMAQQQQNFVAWLRILSRRTMRPESIPPRQNEKGYFEADGFLIILVTGEELGEFKKEIFQAYDYSRFPGVTCHYTKSIPELNTQKSKNELHSYNDADFVGGVSNKKEGFASMDYARPTVLLRARKSWFFSDDMILCLGSGITLPSSSINENSVITTLNQILYNGSHTVGNEDTGSEKYITEPVTEPKTTTYNIEGKPWFHHSSIGYVPILHRGNIIEEVDKRYINGDTTKPSIISYSLWLDHGSSPSDESYVYALLPGQTVTQTKDFARDPPVKILSLTNFLHAACLMPKKVLGASFFSKGCLTTSCLGTDVDQVCTDKPASLIIKDLSNEPIYEENCPGGLKSKQLSQGPSSPLILQISVADPTQKLSNILLTMATSLEFWNIPFTLPAPPKAGKSVTTCYQFV